MLTKINPFAFASSSNNDPLTVGSESITLPPSVSWERLVVNLAVDIPADQIAAAVAAAAPTPEPATPPMVEAAPIADAPMSIAEVAVALAAIVLPSVASTPTVAPAPALVQIAEPAAQPAPSATNLPTGPAPDAAYDAYANLFRGIEDRDLLADLQGSLSPASPWLDAFNGPLG